jgi:hypothetical protein
LIAIPISTCTLANNVVRFFAVRVLMRFTKIINNMFSDVRKTKNYGFPAYAFHPVRGNSL